MIYRLMIIILAIAAGVLLMLTSSCSRIAGATTETTNGVAGIIRTSDDTPASNTVVCLYPDDYDPITDSLLGEKYVDTTDAEGRYRFMRVTAGSYVVLARNRTAATSFLARNIMVTDDTTTTAPPGMLGQTGSIMAVFSPIGSTVTQGYIYIPGTDIASPIGIDGSALLTGVPTGTISAIMLASRSTGKRNVLRDEIIVTASDTAIIDQPLWKYRCRLGLNTTPAGADVAGDVYNFPVLIRLNSDNFDFSQTRSDGGDLLFTGNGNTSLPFEIERWDAGSSSADVWVKVDTVFGNDSTQSIMMYWGNPESVKSTVSTVFDTADGYQGVWHMSDATDGLVHDATVNRYDGTSPDTARPQVAAGAVGNCFSFDGDADYITMANTAAGKLNFIENDYYTVSTWVLLDTFDNASHCIVSKGYEQYYLRSTYISMPPSSVPLWEFVEFSETNKWQPSNSPAAGRQWVLLAGVRQGARQLLYCNGVLVDSTVDRWTNDVSRNTGNDLYLGRFAQPVTVPINEGYCYFKGSIDEVRIISAAQSSDWVRLCYMNQRPDDRLVVFR